MAQKRPVATTSGPARSAAERPLFAAEQGYTDRASRRRLAARDGAVADGAVADLDGVADCDNGFKSTKDTKGIKDTKDTKDIKESDGSVAALPASALGRRIYNVLFAGKDTKAVGGAFAGSRGAILAFDVLSPAAAATIVTTGDDDEAAQEGEDAAAEAAEARLVGGLAQWRLRHTGAALKGDPPGAAGDTSALPGAAEDNDIFPGAGEYVAAAGGTTTLPAASAPADLPPWDADRAPGCTISASSRTINTSSRTINTSSRTINTSSHTIETQAVEYAFDDDYLSSPSDDEPGAPTRRRQAMRERQRADRQLARVEGLLARRQAKE